MPDNTEQPTVIMAKPSFPLPPKKPLILGGVVLLFIIGLILFQKFYPQPVPTLSPSQSPLPDLTKGIYKCPSSKEFCEGGRDIIKDKTYAGFGGEVATGSAVLAAFDGKVTGLTITLPSQFKKEKLNVIYLDNAENNIRATYYFKGEEINFNELDAEMGANLGIIGGRMLYYDVSLLFTITRGDAQTGEKIRVTSKDFI